MLKKAISGGQAAVSQYANPNPGRGWGWPTDPVNESDSDDLGGLDDLDPSLFEGGSGSATEKEPSYQNLINPAPPVPEEPNYADPAKIRQQKRLEYTPYENYRKEGYTAPKAPTPKAPKPFDPYDIADETKEEPIYQNLINPAPNRALMPTPQEPIYQNTGETGKYAHLRKPKKTEPIYENMNSDGTRKDFDQFRKRP